ncbi:MFS transporter [Streptomyces sp. NPDC057494]|uniref:MFS transporter n=1 Tax=Streptomyces sp. NPDC057494 TaxID=3346148 RepID=UPI003678B1B2
MRETFPDPARRAKAIALWGVGGSAGSAAGPVASGLLTMADWRLIFFVNLPVGAAAPLLLRRADRSPVRPAPFDWTGPITAVVAMAALTFAAIAGGADGFMTTPVLAALAATTVAASVFVIAQARGRHPMTPLPLLRSHHRDGARRRPPGQPLRRPHPRRPGAGSDRRRPARDDRRAGHGLRVAAGRADGCRSDPGAPWPSRR